MFVLFCEFLLYFLWQNLQRGESVTIEGQAYTISAVTHRYQLRKGKYEPSEKRLDIPSSPFDQNKCLRSTSQFSGPHQCLSSSSQSQSQPGTTQPPRLKRGVKTDEGGAAGGDAQSMKIKESFFSHRRPKAHFVLSCAGHDSRPRAYRVWVHVRPCELPLLLPAPRRELICGY
ncbi:hypothetical protein WN943_010104 [Citrus x changshan-huyou]